MNVNEHRVRELAYQIWQSEGCPDGEHHRHWNMACQLAEAEQQPSAAHLPASQTRKPAIKPTEATAAIPAADLGLIGELQAPTLAANQAAAAKPRTPRTRASAEAPVASTDGAAGTPDGIKKTRAPRKKKDA